MHEVEHDIEFSILQWLQAEGVFAWKNVSAGFYDAIKGCFRKHTNPYIINGTSDILGILPGGILLAIEVKTKRRRKKVTLEQQMFIDDVNRRGGVAFVATSIADCIDELKKRNFTSTSSN
jgi:hypothetical protein